MRVKKTSIILEGKYVIIETLEQRAKNIVDTLKEEVEEIYDREREREMINQMKRKMTYRERERERKKEMTYRERERKKEKEIYDREIYDREREMINQMKRVGKSENERQNEQKKIVRYRKNKEILNNCTSISNFKLYIVKTISDNETERIIAIDDSNKILKTEEGEVMEFPYTKIYKDKIGNYEYFEIDSLYYVVSNSIISTFKTSEGYNITKIYEIWSSDKIMKNDEDTVKKYGLKREIKVKEFEIDKIIIYIDGDLNTYLYYKDNRKGQYFLIPQEITPLVIKKQNIYFHILKFEKEQKKKKGILGFFKSKEDKDIDIIDVNTYKVIYISSKTIKDSNFIKIFEVNRKKYTYIDASKKEEYLKKDLWFDKVSDIYQQGNIYYFDGENEGVKMQYKLKYILDEDLENNLNIANQLIDETKKVKTNEIKFKKIIEELNQLKKDKLYIEEKIKTKQQELLDLKAQTEEKVNYIVNKHKETIKLQVKGQEQTEDYLKDYYNKTI